MGCFSGPEAPDAGDQWTDFQARQLARPLTGAVGYNLFGGTQGSAFPTFQTDPYLYQGPYAAPMSSLQQQYFDAAPGVMGSQMETLGRIANGQAPMDAMYRYGQRFAEDVITPNVMERFAGLGTANSGGAMKGLARELGTYGLGLTSQIGQAGLENQRQQIAAVGAMNPALSQLGLAGGEQRNIAQQMISGDINRSRALHPLLSPTAQQAMNLLGFRVTPQPEPAGMGYSLLAGAAPAIGGAALGGIGGALSTAPNMSFGQGMLYGLV